LGTGHATITLTVNTSLARAASEGSVQLIAPALPAAGVVQDHPGGALKDENTASPAGIEVEKTACEAA